jgi:fructokinase
MDTMFLVSGEALMDVFAVGETPTGITLDARIGGSPFNVAVGLARLGQPVSFLAGLSGGFIGQRLKRALRDEGVGTESVVDIDAPATLSLIGLDAAGVPSYSFYGHGAADRLLTAEALERIPDGVLAFHFGSYAMVVDPVAQTQRALVEREHRRSLIAYDPNVRLNVEPDLARWLEALNWMLPRTHLIKISDEDLDLLFPGRAAKDFAAHALAQGVRAVVVTKGAHGAAAWTASGQVRVPSPPVKVVDTVGAGDTFQAAMLAWLAEQGQLDVDSLTRMTVQDLAAMVGFATRAAAITCSRKGADLPRRAALD